MKQGGKGFTLIELLVVISIISILAAITFPTLAKAREKARQITCLANVKQLCYATLMYADDYDDTLPPSVQRQPGVPITDSSYLWTTSLLTYYVRDPHLFICPTAKGKSVYVNTWGERGRLSYGLNRDLEDRATNSPYQMVMFSDPALTILLADSTCGTTGDPDNARGYQVQADCAPDTQFGLSTRHNGGANVGFLDGHAKWHNASSIYRKDNSAGFRWTHTP